MQIKEILARGEIFETSYVLKQIYKNLDQETYVEDILNMMQRGYKMAAVFEENSDIENGRCIGVVGVRIIRKLQHGKAIEIEDFMIDRKKRGIGVGKMLIRWVEWQALNFNCKNIIGNLKTKRLESQKIFAREGFILDGFFFSKSS
jgi:GNAT superfamily N-acetyltransferase